MSGFLVQNNTYNTGKEYVVAQNDAPSSVASQKIVSGTPHKVQDNNAPNALEAKVYEPRHVEIEQAPQEIFEFDIVATVILKDGTELQIDKAIVEYFINVILYERGISRKEAKKNPAAMSEIMLEAVERALLFYAMLREEKGEEIINNFDEAKSLVARAEAKAISKVSTEVDGTLIVALYYQLTGKVLTAEKIKNLDDGKTYNEVKDLVIKGRIKRALNEKYLQGTELTHHDPMLIVSLMTLMENSKIGNIAESDFKILKDSIDSLPHDHKDKAFFLASYALLLAKTKKRDNIEEARVVFAEAQKAGNDPRVDIMQARFHVMLGEYDDANKLYDEALSVSKKNEDLQLILAIADDLISLDLLIDLEINSSLGKNTEIILKGLSRLSFGGLLNFAIFKDRKIHEEEELKQFRAKTQGIAFESIKDLTKISKANNDPGALVFLGDSILREYNTRVEYLKYMEKEEKISPQAAEAGQAICFAFIVLYYPIIAENAIEIAAKAASEAKTEEEKLLHTEGLLFIADNLFGIHQVTSDLSSSGMMDREMIADIAEKAFKEAIKLTDNPRILATIGRQLFIMDKDKTALKAFGKIAEINPRAHIYVDYANLALGLTSKAQTTFISSSAQFEGIQIIGAESVDQNRLKAAALLAGGDEAAMAMAIMSVYRREGYRAALKIKDDNGKIIIEVIEVKIDKIYVVPEEGSEIDGKDVVDWLAYLTQGEVAAGQTFNSQKLEASLIKTGQRINTFEGEKAGWIIKNGKNGPVLVIQVSEIISGDYEFGGSTSTSGKKDLRGFVRLNKRFRSGKELSLSASGGRIGDKDIMNGSVSYYNPHLSTWGGKRISSRVSVFRESYLNYFADETQTKSGGNINLETDIGKNTTAWVSPWGYGLEESGVGIYGLYTGITYDTRNKDRGNYFSIYAGPGFGTEGDFFKAQFDGRKYIPIYKGSYIALRAYGGYGNNLPGSELFYFGKDQNFWRGELDEVLMGNGFLGGSAELRTKKYWATKNIGLQPYVFADTGSAFDWDSSSMSFVPWGGAGLRIYMPILGCVNVFYGWPLGPSGTPNWGFTFGPDAVY